MSHTSGAARLAALFLPFLFVACAGDPADSAAANTSMAMDSTPLDPGAVRQPIPPGIDPAMVEWRSDGVLIASRDSLAKTAGYVVDSILPPEEALRRFQAEAGGRPPAALSGGERSTDALLRRYWATLVRGDSLALAPIVLSKLEFAYLYFPESAEPASGLQPQISWLLLESNSGRGLTRALRLAAASDSTLLGTTCVNGTVEAGRNTILGPCAIIRSRNARPDTVWISTHVLQRDGVFKLMSFANEL
jgi:hypothetical protein